MSGNQELIEKTLLTTGLVDGGQLNAEQQTRFVVLIRRFATLLSQVRFVRMRRPTIDIDKMHIGEPLTSSASENTGVANYFVPKFNKVTLTASKVRTDWNLTTELLQTNIEQERFEDTIMQAITERMATDLELLAIQGNTATTTPDVPLIRLLKTLDGWDKKTDNCHIVDVNSGNISKAVYSAMKRTLPKQFRNDPGLRFMFADDVVVDWQDALADRATPMGDTALGQRASGLAPYGIPLVSVPLFPDEKTNSSMAQAQPAYLLGDEFGPFEFTTANNTMDIEVDGVGSPGSTAQTVNINFLDDSSPHTGANATTTATLDATTVARYINATLSNENAAYGNVARVTNEGRLLLVSPTSGTSSDVIVGASSPGGAATTLGFGSANNSDVGTVAGSGVAPDHSFGWLGNPKNLIWGILDGTRIFVEFNRDLDRIEATIYNQVALEVENVDAMVKATNVRKKSAFG